MNLYAENRKKPVALAQSYVGSRGPGYHGIVTDKNTGERFKVDGAECSIQGCWCAVTVQPVSEKEKP